MRLGLSLAGASLLGLPTVLFFWLGTQGQAPVTSSVNPAVAIGTGVFLLGIAAWFGGELAFRTQPSAPPDRRRFLVWLGALVVACTLYGAVIGVLTVRYVFIIYVYSTAVSWAFLLGGMTCVAFVLGLLARRYSRSIAWLAGCIAAGLAVIVTVAAGFGMGLVIFLTYHATTCVVYVPYNLPPLSCINYGPHPPFIPAPGSAPDLTFAGLVVGLWLAGIVGPAIFASGLLRIRASPLDTAWRAAGSEA